MIICVMMALQAQGAETNHLPLEDEVSKNISSTIRIFLTMHKNISDMEDELVEFMTSLTNDLLPPEAVETLDPNHSRRRQYMAAKQEMRKKSDDIRESYQLLCNSREELVTAFYTFDKPFIGAHAKEPESCVCREDFPSDFEYHKACLKRFQNDRYLRDQQGKQLNHFKETLKGIRSASLSVLSSSVEDYLGYAQKRGALMTRCLLQVHAALKKARSFNDIEALVEANAAHNL